MIAIEKKYSGKPLRIYIEDGRVLLSVRDVCALFGERNPNGRLAKAGIDMAYYRSLGTNGGVQRMRLVTPSECALLFASMPRSRAVPRVAEWLGQVFQSLAALKQDFCGCSECR